jgi:serine/threonine-protein kinase
MNDHPPPEQLERLFTGQLDSDLAQTIEAHLDDCGRCLEALERMGGNDPRLAKWRRLNLPGSEAPPPLDLPLRQRLVQSPPGPEQLPADDPPTMDYHAGAGAGEADPLFPTFPCQFTDRYRIIERLGDGGMGVVYLAHDAVLDKRVALKVCRFPAGDDPAMAAQFLREARAAAGVEHEAICRVLDYGEKDGRGFYTMDYIPGRRLSELLGDDQLPRPAEVARIVLGVARGLEAAHSRGVCHRDVKPSNILIDTRGQPHVIDFGLTVRAHDPALPESGMQIGTLAYMSPEQVQGRESGYAADVYSLGVTLYQLLTGRQPFTGQTRDEIEQHIGRGEPVLPRSVRPGVPRRLQAVCLKAMARQPDDRYTTMGDLIASLERSLRPKAPWAWWAAVATAAAVALLLIAWRPWQAAEAERRQVVPLKGDLDLRVTQKGNPLRQALLLHQQHALPLRTDDEIQIDVAVNRPAYLYLVYLDSQGGATPLFPWKKRDWRQRPAEERRDWLRNTGPLDAGPSGVESLLLLVREEPLPEDGDLPKLFAGLPKQNELPDPRSRAWFENGELVRHDPDRGPPVLIGQGDPRDDAVVQTQALLRDKLRPLFPYTRAVCFAFQGD